MTLTIMIIVWIALCIFTDYKIYLSNQNFYKNNKEWIEKNPLCPYKYPFLKKYVIFVFCIFYPYFLIGSIFWYGLVILKSDRNIFNGEKFN